MSKAIRNAIINPQEVAGEAMKMINMTRGMLFSEEFGKSVALCAKMAVPMIVVLAVAVAF